MARRGGGVATALMIALSLCVFAGGAYALYYVLTADWAPSAQDESVSPLQPKEFSEYDWDELAEVAALIAEAPSAEEGEEVAGQWGIELGDKRVISLSDGRQASLTVVGFCHDERADGSGRAGITLMTSPISLQPMNDALTNVGGWEASALRSWLSSEGAELLPEELVAQVVTVSKLTNNVGSTSDASMVSSTDDQLWVPSVSEVCGQVDLFASEFGDEVRSRTGYVDYTAYDAVLCAEGEQYPYFRELGVTCHDDSQHALELSYGGASTSWWYRSPYPLSFNAGDYYYFYQVMSTGHPTTLGSPDEPSGVVVGLCL